MCCVSQPNSDWLCSVLSRRCPTPLPSAEGVQFTQHKTIQPLQRHVSETDSYAHCKGYQHQACGIDRQVLAREWSLVAHKCLSQKQKTASGAVRSRATPRTGVTKSGGKQSTYIATAWRLLGALLSQCQVKTWQACPAEENEGGINHHPPHLSSHQFLQKHAYSTRFLFSMHCLDILTHFTTCCKKGENIFIHHIKLRSPSQPDKSSHGSVPAEDSPHAELLRNRCPWTALGIGDPPSGNSSMWKKGGIAFHLQWKPLR